jgi:hypothetical protein
VSGEYDGRPVKVGFSPCAFGPDYQGSWERFLPTEAQENEVSVDRAIGPFALGDTGSSVQALLARTPAATAGGLYIYHPWDFLSSACGRTSDGEPSPTLAMRYDGAGRVMTVIADQNTLAVEGREVWSLFVRCPHGEAEDVSQSEGPLRRWTPVTCGGLNGLADHPLDEASKGQATTILLPEGEADQFSFVIVTSAPFSACEDAARLHAEAETRREANGTTKSEEEELRPITEEEKKREEEEKAHAPMAP